MKVFVTGGTGFFGKSLVRALAERAEEVRVLARPSSDLSGLEHPRVKVVPGDVEDREALRSGLAGADHLFHGAAVVKELVKDRSVFDRVNVEALDALLTLAREAGVKRVVYTSSFFAIGPSEKAPDGVADETWRREERYCTDYERTKYLAEARVAEQARAGTPVVSVLPGFIMGPGSMTEANLVVRTLLDREQGRLPALPDGGRRRWCLAYIPDVIQGHLLALEKGRVGERYIIGGDNPSLREMLEEYHRLGGKKPPSLPMPHFALTLGGVLGEWQWRLIGGNPLLSRGKACAARHDWAYRSDKAIRELGYRPTPWKEAFGRTVEWMRSQGLMGRS